MPTVDIDVDVHVDVDADVDVDVDAPAPCGIPAHDFAAGVTRTLATAE